VCWEPLKAVLQSLSSALEQHTVMDLAHVSPGLANLTHTRVPMPGLTFSTDGVSGLQEETDDEARAAGVCMFVYVRRLGVV